MAENTATGDEFINRDSGTDAPNRRRVLAGAVWSVPVLATVLAAPAHAASRPCASTFTFSPTTQVSGVTTFVTNTAYTSGLTITQAGGSPTSTVRVSLIGAGLTFDGGGTTRDVALVSGSTTVQIVATAGTGTGSLTVQVLGQTPACAVTTLPIRRRTLTYDSNFGIGYYPNTSASASPGRLQLDTSADTGAGKFHRIVGTVAGDVISDIFCETGITDGWSTAAAFAALPGSNTNWSAPVATGATFQAVAGGETRTFRVYRFRYLQNVAGVDGTTSIPIGFYFRQSGVPFVANQFARTTRYALVNGTPVTLTRLPAAIVNTGNTNPPAP